MQIPDQRGYVPYRTDQIVGKDLVVPGHYICAHAALVYATGYSLQQLGVEYISPNRSHSGVSFPELNDSLRESPQSWGRQFTFRKTSLDAIGLATALSDVYLVHAWWYEPEDIDHICSPSPCSRESYLQNAVLLKRQTDGVEHYMAYNACKRILYIGPDVRNPYSNPSNMQCRLMCARVVVQRITISDKDILDPWAFLTTLLFKFGILLQLRPGYIRKLFMNVRP